MSIVDQATQTQLKNIQTRTGKTLEALYAELAASGLAKHGELRDHLKTKLGMGHGDANTLVTLYLRARADAGGEAAPATPDAAIEGIYAGGKEHFRPIHDRLMAAIGKFGPLEVAPKKAYVSLRRKKQFATLGPASKTRFEVGLNVKGIPATARLLALPPGGMCQYKVNLTDPKEVDAELLAWIRAAYDGAG